ncbi:unnamed protein product [Blepharisma stoltei]|uniref:Uncharacterized protein n=1 Tax=Blepharisma stoltei TaxID=1481888 RepID=A0AAU9JZI9_9CILI|nr:unnamed protein product [Blepharisma stoltei]
MKSVANSVKFYSKCILRHRFYIEISHRWRSLPLICPLWKFFGSTSTIWFGQTKKFFQWANQGQTAPSMGKFYKLNKYMIPIFANLVFLNFEKNSIKF